MPTFRTVFTGIIAVFIATSGCGSKVSKDFSESLTYSFDNLCDEYHYLSRASIEKHVIRSIKELDVLAEQALEQTIKEYKFDRRELERSTAEKEQCATYDAIAAMSEDTTAVEVYRSAMANFIQAMDPHSRYISPEKLVDEKKTESGDRIGPGFSLFADLPTLLGRPIEFLVVEQVFSNGPAIEMIKAGDKILEIDDTALISLSETPFSYYKALKLLYGNEGTKLDLTIARNEKTLQMKIVRKSYYEPTVLVQIPADHPELLYIKLRRFTKTAANELNRILGGLDSNHHETKALLLDLRNNPGGYLDEAIAIVDSFIDKGIVIHTRGKTKYKQINNQYAATAAGALTTLPLMVLVNQRSASASEIVAGALQDYGRAIIAGATTYGKGSVQSILVLPDSSNFGGSIHLTTARYYLPDGHTPQLEGVKPEISLSLPAMQKWLKLFKDKGNIFREIDYGPKALSPDTLPTSFQAPATLAAQVKKLQALIIPEFPEADDLQRIQSTHLLSKWTGYSL